MLVEDGDTITIDAVENRIVLISTRRKWSAAGKLAAAGPALYPCWPSMPARSAPPEGADGQTLNQR